MIPRIFIFLVVWKFSVASDPAHPLQSYIDAGIDLEKCNWSESMCVLFHRFPIPSQEHIFTTKCRVNRNQISGRIRVDACSPESRRGNFYQEQCLDKGFVHSEFSCDSVLKDISKPNANTTTTIPAASQRSSLVSNTTMSANHTSSQTNHTSNGTGTVQPSTIPAASLSPSPNHTSSKTNHTSNGTDTVKPSTNASTTAPAACPLPVPAVCPLPVPRDTPSQNPIPSWEIAFGSVMAILMIIVLGFLAFINIPKLQCSRMKRWVIVVCDRIKQKLTEGDNDLAPSAPPDFYDNTGRGAGSGQYVSIPMDNDVSSRVSEEESLLHSSPNLIMSDNPPEGGSELQSVVDRTRPLNQVLTENLGGLSSYEFSLMLRKLPPDLNVKELIDGLSSLEFGDGDEPEAQRDLACNSSPSEDQNRVTYPGLLQHKDLAPSHIITDGNGINLNGNEQVVTSNITDSGAGTSSGDPSSSVVGPANSNLSAGTNVDGNGDGDAGGDVTGDVGGHGNAVPGSNVSGDIEIGQDHSTARVDTEVLENIDESQTELSPPSVDEAAASHPATTVSFTDDQPVGSLPCRPDASDAAADENPRDADEVVLNLNKEYPACFPIERQRQRYESTCSQPAEDSQVKDVNPQDELSDNAEDDVTEKSSLLPAVKSGDRNMQSETAEG